VVRRAIAAALAAALAGCWSLLAAPTAGAHAGPVVVTVDADRTAGTTNRKLVPATTTSAADSCGHCHARHIVEPGARPVRWNARLDD